MRLLELRFRAFVGCGHPSAGIAHRLLGCPLLCKRPCKFQAYRLIARGGQSKKEASKKQLEKPALWGHHEILCIRIPLSPLPRGPSLGCQLIDQGPVQGLRIQGLAHPIGEVSRGSGSGGGHLACVQVHKDGPVGPDLPAHTYTVTLIGIWPVFCWPNPRLSAGPHLRLLFQAMATPEYATLGRLQMLI